MPEETAQPNPASTTQPPPPTHKNGIYIPRNEPGCISAERTERTTQRNYERLVADPYHGAIVIDAQSGRILFEERAGAYGYPASVTKLMTLLLTLEAIDRGEIQLSDRVLINNEVAGIGGSQLYLDPKEKNFSVEDMLYGIMVHSANDAARALGIHAASSKAFIERMNQRERAVCARRGMSRIMGSHPKTSPSRISVPPMILPCSR